MKQLGLQSALFFLLSSFVSAAERPNFVWILSEDNSKHYLKLFDEDGAAAPNIESLAADGVVFEHAFSCSPVCSIARTTLATGCYAPRIGTQFHRKIKIAQMPAGLKMFPAYLRDAGYYTTNNAKKDYNAVEGKGVWDESSRKATWRNRLEKSTPFFHMQSFADSHESSLHFSKQQMANTKTDTDPAKVTLPPYFPDTPTFRYTYARYHDRIRLIDGHVGRIVDRLKQDDLLEDTFIFYFGDHGGVLPRSKGYVYESGLHVPLVVRIPKNWRHLVDMKPGSRAKGFVSFIDFAPTLLHLAGIRVPKQMDGLPFLGKDVTAEQVNSRDEAFGHADRFDEKYDLCRSLRKGHLKYIRNYQAFYPDALQNNYRYRMLAYQEWRALHEQGNLDAAQRQFFESKSPEALYDLRFDPHEVNNLADDPKYAKQLADMRNRLMQRVKSLPDLSFFPESVLVNEAMDDPVGYGQSHADEISQLVDVADLSLLSFEKAKPQLVAALKSENPRKRYWALITCGVFGKQAAPLANQARKLLTNDNLLVRVRAAEFLGLICAEDPRPTIAEVLKTSQSSVVSLLTLNTVVFLEDHHGYDFKISAANVLSKKDGVERRLLYLKE